MNRSTIITLTVLVAILLLSFFYLSQIQTENIQETLESSQAADVLLKDQVYYNVNNEPIELTNYLGQTIVAIAWASWCSTCHEDLKVVAEVANEYDEVVVLAFNRNEPLSTVNNYLQFYDLNLDVEYVVDTEDHFFNSVGGQTMPEIIVFDTEGNISHHIRDGLSSERLVEVLNKI